MLGYIIVMITFIYMCFQRNSNIAQEKSNFINAGVSESELSKLRIFLWLYLPSIILSFSTLSVVTAVLFVPGILKGKSLHATLDSSGVDYGAKAGRLADQIAWLGIGGLIYVLAAAAFQFGFEFYKRNAY